MASELFKSEVRSDNPVFRGMRLDFPSIRPRVREHGIVYRAKDTLFRYFSWPSVVCGDDGTLFAASSAFRMEHVCPFGKVAMYVSKTNGKRWSNPIIMADDYCENGYSGGGLAYAGNGRLILSWCSNPGDVYYNEFYNRVNGTIWKKTQTPFAKLREQYVELFPLLPPEKLIGGAFVAVSEDNGLTWSDPVRIPVQNVHGATRCKDGTLLFLGKEFYADPAKTFERFRNNVTSDRIFADTWDEWASQLNASRAGDEHRNRPIFAYASTDGGYTWKKRGICEKPDDLAWNTVSEPHAVELPDGTILGAMRVESEVGFDNDFTVYVTRSEDQGRTFSAWECTHVCGAPPHLLVHSSGAVILTVGRRVGDRLGQFAIVSEDGGRTWTKEYAVNDEGPNLDLGYPATAELPDGSLLTVYYQRYVDPETGAVDPKCSILCTRWTLD